MTGFSSSAEDVVEAIVLFGASGTRHDRGGIPVVTHYAPRENMPKECHPIKGLALPETCGEREQCFAVQLGRVNRDAVIGPPTAHPDRIVDLTGLAEHPRLQQGSNSVVRLLKHVRAPS